MKDRKEHANHRMWSQTLNYSLLIIHYYVAYVPGCTTTIKFSVALRLREASAKRGRTLIRSGILFSILWSPLLAVVIIT